MSTATVVTVVKILESLPEAAQKQALEYLREYLTDLGDELEWDALVERTQPGLIAAARRAKEDIAAGLAEPMDYDRL